MGDKTTSKHTPGPWELEENTWLPMEIKTENYRVICEVSCDEVWGEFGETVRDPTEEQLANANLIAASPKLLRALKGVLSSIEEVWGISLNASIDETTEAQLLEAHEAIDEAEGKA